MRREERWYYGILIHPAAMNSSGIRWWAFGRRNRLRADTLNGIKQLIRMDLGVED